ncbi:terpene synthase family protein [Streptomyces sp. CBMA156]|uniref:terpene synthase family protein n=1 Tax=Streptomyces sp. CBMA156 TaxID=1930280 RepID=UPI001662192D|nr:germacradienol/geosmin synthase [Streptomyces sp. CBMA156]
MAAISMPDFYLPWPARLNPHLETARAQSLLWVREMDMLEPVWDEERFTAMDFALFAAWTHPDASPDELCLMSDWYVWGWYVDDYFPQAYTEAEQLGSAREYLFRLLDFMPLDGSASGLTPENPLERGLADLWARTAPGKSEPWLRRYVAVIQDMAEEALRELFNLARDGSRVLDPIEYLEMRRSVGGILWSAQLLEHALGLELPPRLLDQRPLELLNAAFADSQGLQNDIISYEIDLAEGKVNNGVTVVEHFLGCETGRAVEVVNDLVTDRLQQFDHTAATELPIVFEEQLLSPDERAGVLRYVQGLKDWMAGNLEWALRPGGRYLPADSEPAPAPAPSFLTPSGLGTAAARLGLGPAPLGLRARSYLNAPRQEREQLELPDFYMPFEARTHGELETAREHGEAYIRRTGILDVPGLGIWDEASVQAADFALFGALTHPDVPLEQLDLLNDWYTWGFLQDDYLLEVFKRRRDLAGAKAYLDRLELFVPAEPVAVLPTPTNPSEQGLADLWCRTAPAVGDELRRKLSASTVVHLRSGVWEVFNALQNRTPELIDYTEMRRQTLGAGVCADLIHHAAGVAVPDAVMTSRPMRRLVTAVGDWAGWFNDVASYQVEIEYEDDVHNGVYALRRFTGGTLPDTVAAVNDLLTARMKEFEHLTDSELPALYDELELGEQERAGMADYVRQLQEWLAGFHAWHLRTGRYTDFPVRTTLPARLLPSPTGLGTSAARIGLSA